MTQKPDAVELLPCPFCGGRAVVIAEIDEPMEVPRYWHVSCDKGCVSTWTTGVKAKAIEQWNTRDTAERDKYRDACERLIGHYGDKTSWYKPFDERGGESLDYNGYTPSGNGYDFARQVKAELEGIEGSEIEVGVE